MTYLRRLYLSYESRLTILIFVYLQILRHLLLYLHCYNGIFVIMAYWALCQLHNVQNRYKQKTCSVTSGEFAQLHSYTIDIHNPLPSVCHCWGVWLCASTYTISVCLWLGGLWWSPVLPDFHLSGHTIVSNFIL